MESINKVYLLNYTVSYDSNPKLKIFKTFESAKEFVHGYKDYKKPDAHIIDFHIRAEEIYDENFKERFHNLNCLRKQRNICNKCSKELFQCGCYNIKDYELK